ncbi:MAG: hypothetical protein KDC38_10230 [Planctomycetes bacterium]|nr:hypothetical protein [Planctomycetota bacterium]
MGLTTAGRLAPHLTRDNVVGNLRALCPAHNLWFAERHFGRAVIRGKTDAARLASSTR